RCSTVFVVRSHRYSLVFSLGPAAPRNPPSSPTRRSSDLHSSGGGPSNRETAPPHPLRGTRREPARERLRRFVSRTSELLLDRLFRTPQARNQADICRSKFDRHY